MSAIRMAYLAALAGMANAYSGVRISRRESQRKPPRKCLNCDNMHQNNNSYCSADCCREYKAKESP